MSAECSECERDTRAGHDHSCSRHPASSVCHDEQMTIWTGEIAGAMSMAGYLRDDLEYADVIDLHRQIADEVRQIVATAFDIKDRV